MQKYGLDREWKITINRYSFESYSLDVISPVLLNNNVTMLFV